MKFTLNGIDITCTPAEFNELRSLGTITAECPSVSIDKEEFANAIKTAGIQLKEKRSPEDAPKPEDVATQRLIDSTDFFHWGRSNIGRLCKSELSKSPDVNDALAKDYKPIKDGYVYVVVDRRKDRISEYYHGYNDAFTTDLAQAVHYSNPDLAFDYVAAHPDKNLCVLRVKVTP